MRLIDADALMDSLDSLCDTVCQYSKVQRSVMCGSCPLGGAFDVVDNAPTVDAMPFCMYTKIMQAERERRKAHEPVKCEECKFYLGDGCDECTLLCAKSIIAILKDKRWYSDFYCAWGEKK